MKMAACKMASGVGANIGSVRSSGIAPYNSMPSQGNLTQNIGVHSLFMCQGVREASTCQSRIRPISTLSLPAAPT